MADAKPNKIVEIMVLTLFSLTNFISVIVTSTCCYMWINKIEIPTALGVFLTAVVTYTFTTSPGIIKDWMTKGSTP